MVTAIVGANWGDEGKGKITDVKAAESDIVVRFQGGSNAGHTIINNYGKFALHQLPSGVFYEHITNIIGNGVALSVENFIKELNSLEERGVPKPKICHTMWSWTLWRRRVFRPNPLVPQNPVLHRFIPINLPRLDFRSVSSMTIRKASWRKSRMFWI